jgi:uncharacterized protein
MAQNRRSGIEQTKPEPSQFSRSSVGEVSLENRVVNSAALRRARRFGCALAIMVKVPEVGSVKTRLVPPLTPDQAASISRCFFRDTADNITAVVGDSSLNVDGVAIYSPPGAEMELNAMLPDRFGALPQRLASFGDRLLFAAEDLFGLGYESVCLINADSPTLPPQSLRSAVSALSSPGDRVVLGPSEDGGYYLIGLKQAHHGLFEGIPWSTSAVLGETLRRAAEMGLKVELLQPWYDVDRAADLKRLCEELFSSNGNPDHLAGGAYPALHTRAYLAKLLQEDWDEHIWMSGLSVGQGSNR